MIDDLRHFKREAAEVPAWVWLLIIAAIFAIGPFMDWAASDMLRP